MWKNFMPSIETSIISEHQLEIRRKNHKNIKKNIKIQTTLEILRQIKSNHLTKTKYIKHIKLKILL